MNSRLPPDPEPDVRTRFRETESKITDALLIAAKMPWLLVLNDNLILIDTQGRLMDERPILVDVPMVVHLREQFTNVRLVSIQRYEKCRDVLLGLFFHHEMALLKK